MDYYDLGTHSRRVSTASNEAQLWFDRGLVWLYGYFARNRSNRLGLGAPSRLPVRPDGEGPGLGPMPPVHYVHIHRSGEVPAIRRDAMKGWFELAELFTVLGANESNGFHPAVERRVLR